MFNSLSTLLHVFVTHFLTVQSPIANFVFLLPPLAFFRPSSRKFDSKHVVTPVSSFSTIFTINMQSSTTCNNPSGYVLVPLHADTRDFFAQFSCFLSADFPVPSNKNNTKKRIAASTKQDDVPKKKKKFTAPTTNKLTHPSEKVATIARVQGRNKRFETKRNKKAAGSCWSNKKKNTAIAHVDAEGGEDNDDSSEDSSSNNSDEDYYKNFNSGGDGGDDDDDGDSHGNDDASGDDDGNNDNDACSDSNDNDDASSNMDDDDGNDDDDDGGDYGYENGGNDDDGYDNGSDGDYGYG